jgi:hypothetical protein
VDDAASAKVLAVEQDCSGVYNIVDDEPAPVSEWLPFLAECAGAKPSRRIPAWLARVLVGDMAVGMMTEGRGFSNASRRSARWAGCLRHPPVAAGFRGRTGVTGEGDVDGCARLTRGF